MNMKVQNIQSKQSFKGFKNVVSHSINQPPLYSYGFMGMKLSNEDGYNDLEVWKQIQKGLNPNAEPSEYIVFQNTNLVSDNVDMFIVDDFLLDINNKKANKPLTKDLEGLILKSNTLVASLTKRIMNSYDVPEDKDYYKSVVHSFNTIKKIIGHDGANDLVLIQASLKRVKHNITAKLINDGISRNMAKFFK